MERVIITTGPAWSAIDDVRRITNFATGEIGAVLAQVLMGAGYEVLCLRGEGATFPMPREVPCENFTTNDSLLKILRREAGGAQAIFHAAALCDFEVERELGHVRKISSTTESLVVRLRPAQKILPLLRGLFPSAFLVGWKYELDGTNADAIEHGRRQIIQAQTDACVVNGTAYGEGFGVINGSDGQFLHCAGKAQMATELCKIIARNP